MLVQELCKVILFVKELNDVWQIKASKETIYYINFKYKLCCKLLNVIDAEETEAKKRQTSWKCKITYNSKQLSI